MLSLAIATCIIGTAIALVLVCGVPADDDSDDFPDRLTNLDGLPAPPSPINHGRN